jgi:hypothetical protein
MLRKTPAERSAWIVAHPVGGAIRAGAIWGVVMWLLMGLTFDNLTLTALVAWLGSGLLFGAISVAIIRIRSRRSRP